MYHGHGFSLLPPIPHEFIPCRWISCQIRTHVRLMSGVTLNTSEALQFSPQVRIYMLRLNRSNSLKWPVRYPVRPGEGATCKSGNFPRIYRSEYHIEHILAISSISPNGCITDEIAPKGRGMSIYKPRLAPASVANNLRRKMFARFTLPWFTKRAP
jgi:hypothetical protein